MQSREETLTVWTDGALAGPANSPAVRSVADRAAYGMAIEGGMTAAGGGFWFSSCVADGMQYDSVRQELMGMAYGLKVALRIHQAHRKVGIFTFHRVRLVCDCADAEGRVRQALAHRDQDFGPDAAEVRRRVSLLENAGVEVQVRRVSRYDAGISEADRVARHARDRQGLTQVSGAEYFPVGWGTNQQEWIANVADYLESQRRFTG